MRPADGVHGDAAQERGAHKADEQAAPPRQDEAPQPGAQEGSQGTLFSNASLFLTELCN